MVKTAQQLKEEYEIRRKTKQTKEQSENWKRLNKKWFARDNFVYAGKDEIGKRPIAECISNIIAVHISCAHNAVRESAKGK